MVGDSPVRIAAPRPQIAGACRERRLIVAYVLAWHSTRRASIVVPPGELGGVVAARPPVNFAGALPPAFSEEVLFRGLVLTELSERWRASGRPTR